MYKIITFSFLLFISNSFSQKNISFLGNLQYSQKINDIWGYTDTNGKEYALVGGTTGFSIVDVSNPSNPNQLFFIEGDTSTWRDVKTYEKYAYVTNEKGGGLLIVDLTNLPNSINSQNWTVGSHEYKKAHNIFIDENGIAYLFGSNIKNQGAFMLDLNSSNKFEPAYVGVYDDQYCHDGFVRNDVLWTSEIGTGDFSAVDVSDKQAPVIIAREQTSRAFTHQCWLSDDNNYLITTDEKAGAYVDIYDVSDINNIERLDKYRSSPDDDVIPHNTFFKGNDYIITSYYRDGITLVDATKKDNLVQVGSYDTSPFPSAEGFEGCWGVYPYLPSGNILASDREEGLFILSPTFTRASYLEGTIKDVANNNKPVNDVRVEVMGTKFIKYSTFDGSYKTGVSDTGFYDIRFSLPHCQTIIVAGVKLLEGQVTNLDIETNCNFPVSVNVLKEEKKYSILANPFKDKINIQFNAKTKLNNIQVFNIQGKLIKQLTVKAFKGNIIINNDWQKGTYILKLIFENVTYQEILIKQ